MNDLTHPALDHATEITPDAVELPVAVTAEQATNADTQEIPVAMIRIAPEFNPRKKFDDADIAEFAERIRNSGWLSPPLVRPDPYGDGYLLVAGERRMRAIKVLGWTTVQVTVKAMSDGEHRRLALAENVDRRDLTIAEEVMYARDYLDSFEGDHAAASTALGWPVQRLRHRLKLLHCSEGVLDAMMAGTITLGHGELLASLPKENQDKALPRIVADQISVATLREQINGFVTPLATAIFDLAGCANCPFNTSCQGTLFEARVNEGNCTNKSCFQEKSRQALELKREELKSDFGVVVLVSEKDPAQSIPLVKHGEQGVGPDGFDACRSCQFRGAAIHDAPGARLGTVESPLCFNRPCHVQKVAAYQAEIAPSAVDSAVAEPSSTQSGDAVTTTTPAKATSTKAAKKSSKVAAPLRSVTDQYGEVVARAAKSALSTSASPALALALIALCDMVSSETATSAQDVWTSLAIPGAPERLPTRSDESLTALWALDEAALVRAMTEIGNFLYTADLNNRPFNARLHRRPLMARLVQERGTPLADHVRVDQAFLEAHTKPALEVVLDESGYRAAVEALDGGAKTYKSMLAGKKPDLIRSVLDSGFNFSGYVPAGLALAIKAWRKEARI
ncbi:PRTRC system ParB family protein [Luteimonas sp. MHLX1A]|uniref:PRTRC system ParB family protein n=1 Tax=Alterluteimonas muca TaxID=2878684 RepID=UPI001E3EC3B8|nr:PRTRC system ParB family protein [Luteimonas sp. MHLX1A]MCD9046759.1 PRTRC system ParB family protein [Luteimonas sp. MHLX1A]